MKRLLFAVSTALVALMLLPLSLFPQTRDQTIPEQTPQATRLPNGKLQQDEILKDDHEKSIKDAAQLVDLAQSLKQEIEKDDVHVLSISTLKKTEEIEKLARRIRARLKRY